MGKTSALFATLSAAVIALAGAWEAAAQQTTPLRVRDSWTPSGLQAAFHYGLEKGIYAKHGIDLRHEDGNGSGNTVAVAAANQTDIAFTDLSVMAIGMEKGMKIISVAGLLRDTTMGVFVPKNSGIKTAKDLEGKEVIFTATSFETPFLGAFFKNGGTSRDKVNLVSVDAAAKLSVYNGGRGMGMITSVPFGAPIVNANRPSDTILWRDYGLILPSYGIVVHTDTLAAKRPLIAAFNRAFFESWSEIMKGREAEAADIIIKRRPEAKLVRDQVIEQIKLHIPYFTTQATQGKPLGWQADEDWAKTIAALEQAELIKAGRKPSDYFTNELVPTLTN